MATLQNVVVEATEHTPLLRHHASADSITSITKSSTRVEVLSTHRKTSIDEEAPADPDVPSPRKVTASITRIISVLLIGKPLSFPCNPPGLLLMHIQGGFISNADGSLLLATHPIIASEFNALDDSSWLLTSFALASATTQPLHGKLSDIYGRKTLLVVSYILFAAGL